MRSSRRCQRYPERLERREMLATDLLAGISRGDAHSSSPESFVQAGDLVYFNAAGENNSNGFWRSDGTPEGTFQIHEESAGLAERFGDDVVFRANGALYRTGGTVATTVRLTDESISLRDDPFVVFEDHIYFHGRDSDSLVRVGGRRPNDKLMRSDGTPGGVDYFGLRDELSRSSLGAVFGIWDDKLHYAYVRSRDFTFWQTDGTEEGVTQLVDADGQLANSDPMVNFGGRLLGRGLEPFGTAASEMSVTDSQTLETVFFDLNPGVDAGSAVSQFLPTPHGAFFVANGGDGFQVWRTDGTYVIGDADDVPEDVVRVYADVGLIEPIGVSLETVRVTELELPQDDAGPRWLTYLNEALYFATDSAVVKYLPETAETIVLSQFDSGVAPEWLMPIGDEIYFTADEGRGVEIWKTDGSILGTSPLMPLADELPFYDPTGLAVMGGSLLFSAKTEDAGNELWRLDTASANASLVRDVYPGVSQRQVLPRDFFEFDDWLYFRVDDGVHGTELWRTDGTVSGTHLFKDIRPGRNSSGPRAFFEFRDEMYFVANDGLHGYELWKSDGTPENTKLLKDIWPGIDGVVQPNFTPFGDAFFFTANDGVHGTELWRSDGTTEGTQLTLDLREGPAFSNIVQIAADENRIVFFDVQDTREETGLWQSDGNGVTLFRNDDAIRFEPTALEVLGDNLLLRDGRGEVYRLDDERFPVTIGRRESTGLQVVDSTDAVWMNRDGVHAIDRLGEVVTVYPRPVDGLEVVGDRVFFWVEGRADFESPSPGWMRAFEIGERIATEVLSGGQIGEVWTDQQQLVVEVIRADDSVELWTVDESPLRTRLVAAPEQTVSEAMTLNGRFLFVAKDGIGESLFWEDSPIANALAGTHQVSIANVDELFAATRLQRASERLDVNQDGAVDDEDIDSLFNDVLGTKRADLDLDGVVDFGDFLTLAQHYGREDASWSQGDLNGDEKVDFLDFLVLSSEFDVDPE